VARKIKAIKYTEAYITQWCVNLWSVIRQLLMELRKSFHSLHGTQLIQIPDLMLEPTFCTSVQKVISVQM